MPCPSIFWIMLLYRSASCLPALILPQKYTFFCAMVKIQSLHWLAVISEVNFPGYKLPHWLIWVLLSDWVKHPSSKQIGSRYSEFYILQFDLIECRDLVQSAKWLHCAISVILVVALAVTRRLIFTITHGHSGSTLSCRLRVQKTTILYKLQWSPTRGSWESVAERASWLLYKLIVYWTVCKNFTQTCELLTVTT